MSIQRIVLVGLASLVIASALGADSIPVTVSPGRVDTLTLVASRCPTFNWGAVPGADRYELVVYRVVRGEARPVLRQSVHGSALGSANAWFAGMTSGLVVEAVKTGGNAWAWPVRGPQ